MKELLAHEKIAKLIGNISQDFVKKDAEISALKDIIKELKPLKKKLEDKLKTNEKQLEKYKKILNITPGTLENKLELLEYFAETIIPHISEKIESKYTGKIIEYLERKILNKSGEEEEKSLESNSQKYYVYSHTLEGELFPFYIGFSRNIDGDYKRSKDFSGRSYPWFEYIFSKGGFNNVKINPKILVEIETEREALELEKYFIKYYSESVVNILGKY